MNGHLLLAVFLLITTSAHSYSGHSWRISSFSRYTRSLSHNHNQNEPISPKDEANMLARRGRDVMLVTLGQLCASKVVSTQRANAVGSLAEFKDQMMVLQDISFNVQDNKQDAAMLKAMMLEKCRQVRAYKEGDEDVIVMGFGADAYKSPPEFTPGVSSFSEDGGHATMTFRSRKAKNNGEDILEVIEQGNALQYIKIAVEEMRLSKGIQNGAKINYAYGWVELDTPGKIPVEIVVGNRVRDPIMLSCIRCDDMKASVDFVTKQLGMKLLPFPLARAEGSDFEQGPLPGSIMMGYSTNSPGLLLSPPPKPAKGASIPEYRLGGVNGFTIVVDDLSEGELPAPVRAFVDESKKGGPRQKTLLDPSGFPFTLKLYSAFAKEATAYAPAPVLLEAQPLPEPTKFDGKIEMLK